MMFDYYYVRPRGTGCAGGCLISIVFWLCFLMFVVGLVQGF